MIVGQDIKPERKIYYLGALALEIIKALPNNNIDVFDAFQKLNEREKISMNLFILTLDWLFILGAIKNNEGRIEKCF